MDKSKKTVEESLKNLLKMALADYNQESGLISLEYDEKTQTCTAKLNVEFYEPDNYIGFESY